MSAVVALRTVTAQALVIQTKAAWDRADQKSADADDWYIRTGKLLIELKGKVDHGEWLPTLKKIGRSDRRAQELMEQAKGRKTLEEQRSRKRDHERKVRAKARHGADLPEPAQGKLYSIGEGQEEERWQNSLANLCGDLISCRAYWTKHFPGWEQFDCPSHIKKLVREAVTELDSITATVTGR